MNKSVPGDLQQEITETGIQDTKTKTFGGKGRGKRGKASATKHQEQFRKRVGEKVQNEYKDRIRNRHPDFDDLTSQLTRMALAGDPVTCEIPITLRGVGLLVNVVYSMIELELKQAPPISRNQMFRLALAQVQLQMIRSESLRRGPLPEVTSNKQRLVQPFMNFEAEVSSHPSTLRAIAAVISCIGSYSEEGCNYTPIIPEGMFARQTLPLDQAEGRKRKRVEESAIPPDPYVVTFQNLRCTVEALANENVPESIRRYFRQHCPIPGCRWSADDVLLNPDDVMPKNYGILHLQREFALHDALISRLSNARTGHLIGEVSYTGSGTHSQLVTHRGETFFLDGDILETMNGNGKLDCSKCLGDIELLVGGVCLFERPEFCDELNNELRAGVEDQYSLRSSRIAVRRFPLPWNLLTDRFTVKYSSHG